MNLLTYLITQVLIPRLVDVVLCRRYREMYNCFTCQNDELPRVNSICSKIRGRTPPFNGDMTALYNMNGELLTRMRRLIRTFVVDIKQVILNRLFSRQELSYRSFVGDIMTRFVMVMMVV